MKRRHSQRFRVKINLIWWKLPFAMWTVLYTKHWILSHGGWTMNPLKNETCKEEKQQISYPKKTKIVYRWTLHICIMVHSRLVLWFILFFLLSLSFILVRLFIQYYVHVRAIKKWNNSRFNFKTPYAVICCVQSFFACWLVYLVYSMCTLYTHYYWIISTRSLCIYEFMIQVLCERP